MREAIVVGGGLAGLTAAIFLANGGVRVRLLERAAGLGGRARSDREADTWLNRGPHALYRGGAAMETLTRLGVSPRGAAPPAKGLVRYGGRIRPLPAGPASILANPLWSLREAWEFGQLLARTRWMDASKLAGMSAKSWIEQELRYPTSRAMLEGLVRVTTYIHMFESFSAAAALEQLKIGLYPGVIYLDGGWQALVDALRGRAEAAGVVVETGARVTGLAWDGARARGVIADDRELAADAVVLAVDPAAAERLLAGRAALPARVPARAACLDLALSRLPKPEDRFLLGLDEPLYLSVHSGVADLGANAAVHVMRYLAPGDTGSEAELEALMDDLQPGWRDLVLHRRYLPAMTVTHDVPQPGQARAPVVLPGLSGVALAGDWVGARGMLADAAFASGADAAAALLAAEVRQAA